MPLLDHLRELRTRLIRCLIAIFVGFILAYFVADPLFQMLTWPLHEVSAGGKAMLIGTGVGEAFFTKMKVALIAGLFIASPVVFHEIWKFIAPGLLRDRTRWPSRSYSSRRSSSCSAVTFAGRSYFRIGYAFFLRQYVNIGVTPTLRISEYLAFSAKLLLAFAHHLRDADFRLLLHPRSACSTIA